MVEIDDSQHIRCVCSQHYCSRPHLQLTITSPLNNAHCLTHSFEWNSQCKIYHIFCVEHQSTTQKKFFFIFVPRVRAHKIVKKMVKISNSTSPPGMGTGLSIKIRCFSVILDHVVVPLKLQCHPRKSSTSMDLPLLMSNTFTLTGTNLSTSLTPGKR